MTRSDARTSTGDRKRLVAAFAITSTVLVAETIGAVVTGSLALLVDAAHMLTDAGGLGMALLAATLTTRPATSRRTWGFARAEVLAATAQAAVLLAMGLFVVVEGARRLASPPEIPSGGLLAFGLIGLAGNVVSIVLLASSRKANLNFQAAFLEVVNDALGSIGVIASAILISVTGWGGADAIAAIVVGVLILPRAFVLLRDAGAVLLESTPAGLDLDEVREHFRDLRHVEAVHDLHASQIASGLPVLTAHVAVRAGCFWDGHAPEILDQLRTCVAEHFAVSVEHSTFQLVPQEHCERRARRS